MNATDILKEKGIKKSAQRIAVINALQSAKRPLGEDEIKVDMGEMYDRITFYRTMQVLVNAGIVHRINVDNFRVEYALNADDGDMQHVHFYCRQCHKVFCLKDIPVNHYDLPEGYKEEDCEILVRGLCPSCSEQEARM